MVELQGAEKPILAIYRLLFRHYLCKLMSRQHLGLATHFSSQGMG